jgi:hypothetical protein
MTEIHATNTHYDNTICLVKPSTCDKVREFLERVERENYSARLGDTDFNAVAAELLKLLPEVE